MESYPDSNCFFIFPPSIAHLEDRLQKRGTETEQSLQTRLTNSKEEIIKGLNFDEKCTIGYRLVNEDLNVSI